jgi:hypothetical protein
MSQPSADPEVPVPRVMSVIVSYNAPHLTARTYEGLLANQGTHLLVLDHSSTEDKIFRSPHTVDLGRDVLTFGECNDIVLTDPQFREYDYVAIWTNDTFDIASDFMPRLLANLMASTVPIGLVSPSIVPGGTPHPHMRRQGSGLRPVPFIETVAPFIRTDLLPVFERFVPTTPKGWGLDIVFSGISRALGFEVVVCDDVEIGHVVDGGTFKELGELEEHGRRAPREAAAWIGQHHLWPLADWTSPDIARYLRQFLEA